MKSNIRRTAPVRKTRTGQTSGKPSAKSMQPAMDVHRAALPLGTDASAGLCARTAAKNAKKRDFPLLTIIRN
jgi:hypothetical protein